MSLELLACLFLGVLLVSILLAVCTDTPRRLILFIVALLGLVAWVVLRPEKKHGRHSD